MRRKINYSISKISKLRLETQMSDKNFSEEFIGEPSLAQLRADFRQSETLGMPIAGAIVWSAFGILALFIAEETMATIALYIMFPILGLAYFIEKLRGKNLFGERNNNPLIKLFLLSVLAVALIVPFAVISSRASDPNLMVLGMAVLSGIVWIFYGWAADDPSGVQHAIIRATGCYAAYSLLPVSFQVSAMCAVVVVCYIYSLAKK